MDKERRRPEEFLRQPEFQNLKPSEGRLKIFFGYAAGVGKTYAMLEAAHAMKNQGLDVVAGYIEPHTRPETMALLEGLPVLNVKNINHGGIILREFDLDGALERKPQIILVDELAHSNAPGSRHQKRYQDVQELLRAGIDVYTSLNVQHIESLNDSVSAITGISVRERIPDFVFDSAYQVEIVDIEPQELLQRLKNGKVYKENQARRAMENFFTLSNLNSLREIALRRCADRVNFRLKSSKSDTGHTEEHILVCLSSSPSNGKIIRTAARMAQAFKGRFTALFVETPDFPAMSRDNLGRLRDNIHLAEQLGASVETAYGSDVPYQIAEFARLSGVSKIVVGRSAAKSGCFPGTQSLTEKLIHEAPELDIHIIPDAAGTKSYHKRPNLKKAFSPADLLKSLLILIVSTLIAAVFDYLKFDTANIIIIYVLGVLVCSVLTENKIFALASSFISVLVFNFFFTEPRLSLMAYGSGYPVTFIIMFLAALITSSLALKLKENAKLSAIAASQNKFLFEINQSMQQAQGREEILGVAAEQLGKLLRRDIILYSAEEGTLSEPEILHFSASPSGDYLSQYERTVALWVYKNGKMAGAGTGTLQESCCLYIAVKLKGKVFAVFGIALGGELLQSSEKSLLLSVAGECALALQNEQNAR